MTFCYKSLSTRMLALSLMLASPSPRLSTYCISVAVMIGSFQGEWSPKLYQLDFISEPHVGAFGKKVQLSDWTELNWKLCDWQASQDLHSRLSKGAGNQFHNLLKHARDPRGLKTLQTENHQNRFYFIISNNSPAVMSTVLVLRTNKAWIMFWQVFRDYLYR